MFAVKFIYLYNCWKKPAAHKQPWKISESWCGVMRGKKVSTGYEKGTDTGNGHIWCRFIVSGVSHSNLITPTAQRWAWHGYIHFSFGLRQNYCFSFTPRTWRGDKFIILGRECTRIVFVKRAFDCPYLFNTRTSLCSKLAGKIC